MVSWKLRSPPFGVLGFGLYGLMEVAITSPIGLYGLMGVAIASPIGLYGLMEVVITFPMADTVVANVPRNSSSRGNRVRSYACLRTLVAADKAQCRGFVTNKQ